MWFEIIRWGSLTLLWFAIGLNIWSAYRSNRAFKQYMRLYKELMLQDFDKSVAKMKAELEKWDQPQK